MKLRAFSPYFSEKVVLTMGSTLVLVSPPLSPLSPVTVRILKT